MVDCGPVGFICWSQAQRLAPHLTTPIISTDSVAAAVMSLLSSSAADRGRREAARASSTSSSSSSRPPPSLPAVTVNKSLIQRVFQSVWQFEGTDSQHAGLDDSGSAESSVTHGLTAAAAVCAVRPEALTLTAELLRLCIRGVSAPLSAELQHQRPRVRALTSPHLTVRCRALRQRRCCAQWRPRRLSRPTSSTPTLQTAGRSQPLHPLQRHRRCASRPSTSSESCCSSCWTCSEPCEPDSGCMKYTLLIERFSVSGDASEQRRRSQECWTYRFPVSTQSFTVDRA